MAPQANVKFFSPNLKYFQIWPKPLPPPPKKNAGYSLEAVPVLHNQILLAENHIVGKIIPELSICVVVLNGTTGTRMQAIRDMLHYFQCEPSVQ